VNFSEHCRGCPLRIKEAWVIWVDTQEGQPGNGVRSTSDIRTMVYLKLLDEAQDVVIIVPSGIDHRNARDRT
jgi:hypothetical protein